MRTGTIMENINMLWIFLFIGLITAQDKIPITMVTSQPFSAQSTNPYPEYYCYLNSPDADATVTARRVWETRANRQSVNNNPAPPSPQLISDNRYPAGSAVYRVDLSFNRNSQSYAFGTFSCDASKGGRKDTNVSNILMNFNVLSQPADSLVTQTVNAGDTDEQIEMEVTGSVQRWYRNGSSILAPDPPSAADRGTYSIANVQKDAHEGVYEAVTEFTNQPRMQPRHGLKRLIVRSCAANHWGPPECAGVCDNCYNGGVCDDETGRCIPPPGFMGENCLTACGGNRFGYSCEFQCSYDGDNEDSCSGLQFCLLDPFGCRCNTGWEDLSCERACSSTTFGASCLQDCHCDRPCDRFTGICNGTCEAGWSGDSCQIPDICPPGYYGPNCIDKCYCKNDTPCEKMTGACKNSECVPGYTVYAGSPKCQECRGDSYGESCLQECRCAADACNKVTGECSGQCKPQWVDLYQCLAGINSASSSRINPNGTSYIDCVAQNANNRADILDMSLSRETDQVVNRGIRPLDRTRMGDTEVWRFTAEDVKENEELFCLLLVGENIVARLSTKVLEYDLPVFSSAPLLVSATTFSITIRWRAWDPDRDDGDPPIVAYVPYYRKAASEEWISGPVVQNEQPLVFLAYNLEATTEYSFSVAAVREGMNGEGPRGTSVYLRTNCDVSDVVPQNVVAFLDETTEQVNISWQIPDMCGSGISTFFIYAKKEGSNQEPRLLSKSDGDVTWITISTQDLRGGEFRFFVTLTIDEESALSQGSEPVMITQQHGDKSGSCPVAVIAIVIATLAMIAIAAVICAVLSVLRYQRLKTVDTVDKSIEGTDYENAGVSLDSEGYCQVEKQLNSRQSKRYEEVDKKQGVSPEDTSYDPVRSSHTKTRAKDTLSEYEDVPMTSSPRISNAIQLGHQN